MRLNFLSAGQARSAAGAWAQRLRLSLALGVALAGFSQTAHAIEFVDNVAAPWSWKENVAAGCMAVLGAAEHNQIYVGSCDGRVPHGRGIYFDNLALFSVRVNGGKIYKTDKYTDEPDLAPYAERAKYVAAYHSIFTVRENQLAGVPVPGDSVVYSRARVFIDQYRNQASAGELAAATEKLDAAKSWTLSIAMNTVKANRNSGDAAGFLNRWRGQLSPAQENEARALQIAFENDERLAREQKARERAEYDRQLAAREEVRQVQRAIRAKTACNGFYPGYVGKFDRGGFFSTADAYVVRYVNSQMRSVTIEGTSSGNSLTYGQIVELNCVDLLDGTK